MTAFGCMKAWPVTRVYPVSSFKLVISQRLFQWLSQRLSPATFPSDFFEALTNRVNPTAWLWAPFGSKQSWNEKGGEWHELRYVTGSLVLCAKDNRRVNFTAGLRESVTNIWKVLLGPQVHWRLWASARFGQSGSENTNFENSQVKLGQV